VPYVLGLLTTGGCPTAGSIPWDLERDELEWDSDFAARLTTSWKRFSGGVRCDLCCARELCRRPVLRERPAALARFLTAGVQLSQ